MKKYICILLALVMALAIGAAAYGENSVISKEDAADLEISTQDSKTTLKLSYDDVVELVGKSDTYTLLQYQLEQDETTLDNYETQVERNSNASPTDMSVSDSYTYVQTENKYEFAKSAAEDIKTVRLNAYNLEIYRTYYQLKFNQESLASKEESVKTAEQSLKIAQKKYELGTVTKSDVLNAEMNYNQAVNSLELAQSEMVNSVMSFNLYVGLDLYQDVELTSEPDAAEMPNITLAEATDLALENRLEMRQAQFNYDEAVAYLEHLKVATTPGTDTYIAAEKSLNKTRISYEKQKANIEMDVRSKYNSMVSAYNSMVTSEQNIAKAEENLSIAKVRYNNGVITYSSLESAESSLTSAKLSYSQAKYNYTIAVQNFIYSYGIGTTVINL